MARVLDFETDGRDWPNKDFSRFANSGGLRWHVQMMSPADLPDAPIILLLHGTGSSTHSWRGLMPMLAVRFRVLAVDLPGHGFTSQPPMLQLSLPGMSMAVVRLLDDMNVAPDVIVGHSAGAAIAIRMTLDGSVSPKGIVSLFGAILPLRGAQGKFFPVAAKLMTLNPFAPCIFSWRVRNPAIINELMSRTGSTLDEEGLKCYTRLARSPGHAGAALRMMANWDLRALARELPTLACPLLLLSAEKDRMIPPFYTEEAHAKVQGSTLKQIPGLGHIAHEEDPAQVAEIIEDFMTELGL